MTLTQAKQIVLTSLAKELESVFAHLQGHLQQGMIRSTDAQLLACEVNELDSMMGYVRTEAERIRRERVSEVVGEVDSLLKADRRG